MQPGAADKQSRNHNHWSAAPPFLFAGSPTGPTNVLPAGVRLPVAHYAPFCPRRAAGAPCTLELFAADWIRTNTQPFGPALPVMLQRHMVGRCLPRPPPHAGEGRWSVGRWRGPRSYCSTNKRAKNANLQSSNFLFLATSSKNLRCHLAAVLLLHETVIAAPPKLCVLSQCTRRITFNRAPPSAIRFVPSTAARTASYSCLATPDRPAPALPG